MSKIKVSVQFDDNSPMSLILECDIDDGALVSQDDVYTFSNWVEHTIRDTLEPEEFYYNGNA